MFYRSSVQQRGAACRVAFVNRVIVLRANDGVEALKQKNCYETTSCVRSPRVRVYNAKRHAKVLPNDAKVSACLKMQKDPPASDQTC